MKAPTPIETPARSPGSALAHAKRSFIPTFPRRILLAAPFIPGSFLHGISRFARSANWHLVTNVQHIGTYPRGWRGDGIVAMLTYQPELAHFIATSGVPTVAVAFTDEHTFPARVEPDNVAIGRLAAAHLLKLAHRNFAWAPFVNDRHNRERLEGFESMLRENLRTCEILPATHRRIGPYWHDDWNHRRGLLIQKLKSLPRPTAVFAFNDCVAADLADACREAGLAVPDEVAILGVGNEPVECESAPVTLSSIDHDLEGMAYLAASLLDRILGEGLPRSEVIRAEPKGVVTRASTGAQAAANPRIAQALAHIVENYPDPLLGVAAVAHAVGLSRRQLERDFRQATGKTVRDFIERSRMNEASRLLKDHPRTKISTIAELVGLSCQGSFVRVFRRHFGATPTAYRQIQHDGGPIASIDAHTPGIHSGESFAESDIPDCVSEATIA